jgi:YcxB-like protein
MAAEEALVVHFRLTPEDSMRFRLAHGCFYWRIIGLFVVLVLALYMEIWQAVSGQATAHERAVLAMTLLTGVGIFGVVICICWLYYRWDEARWHRKIGDTLADCTLSISPEGVFWSDKQTESRLRWSAVKRTRATRDHLAFYLDTDAALIIPRRAFASPAKAEAFLQAAMAWHQAATRGSEG